MNATNNDYTPVGIDNLCEDGFCEWCHTTKSHPNFVNQVYVALPYCECEHFICYPYLLVEVNDESI